MSHLIKNYRKDWMSVLDHTNGPSVLLNDKVRPGCVWWVNNKNTEDETNLIKKNRPFLILNVTQGYSTYKVTGIMLQSRQHFLTSKYEYIIDRLNDGRYSVADVSNVTTIDVEDLSSYMYEAPPQVMRVVRGMVAELANPNNEKRYGQVWQMGNQDYLIYRVSENPVTHNKKVTVLPVVNRRSEEVGLCDVVIGSVTTDSSVVKVVTVGTESVKNPEELTTYKYAVSDICIGKLNEGINKVNSMKQMILSDTVMEQVGRMLNYSLPRNQSEYAYKPIYNRKVSGPSQVKVDSPKPIKNNNTNRPKPRYTRK